MSIEPIEHLCHVSQCLKEVRSEVSKVVGLPEEDLELSMGMSGDFEQAVRVFQASLQDRPRLLIARGTSCQLASPSAHTSCMRLCVTVLGGVNVRVACYMQKAKGILGFDKMYVSTRRSRWAAPMFGWAALFSVPGTTTRCEVHAIYCGASIELQSLSM